MRLLSFLLIVAIVIFVYIQLSESYKLNVPGKHLVKRAKIYVNRTKLVQAVSRRNSTLKLTTTTALPTDPTDPVVVEVPVTESPEGQAEEEDSDEEPVTECPPPSCCVCCYPPGCPNKPLEKCGKCAIPCKHVVCPQWV